MASSTAKQPATSDSTPAAAPDTVAPARPRRGRPPGRRSAPPAAAAPGPAPAPEPPEIDIYARLSYAADGTTIKVDDQIEIGREEIERRGGRVGRVFKDNSRSAWNPKVARPQWDEMMTRLETGAANGVMVYDVSRYTRKVMEGERLVEAANNGARVWSLSGEYNLTSADGRAQFRDAVKDAAKESDKISERVRRGTQRRLRKGKALDAGARAYGMPGWEAAPPGWREERDWRQRDRTAAERVEAEREIVRECYRRLLAGESISVLVRELNARGAAGDRAALPVSGAPWRRGVFIRSMCRPALAGLLAHKGEVVGEIAKADPVVSREDWQRLCALADARKVGRPASPRHVLSGLVLCTECGAPLLGYPRGGLPPYPDGEPKREYRCRPRADHPRSACGRNHIDGRTADQAVAAAVEARLGDPRNARKIAARLTHTAAERVRIEGEIDRWEITADDLAAKTAQWGVDRVDRAMRPILDSIAALRDELAALEEPDPATAGSSSEAVQAWRDAVAAGDVAAQRALIRRAFPRLALIRPRRYGDHSPERFRWDGVPGIDPAPPARIGRRRNRPDTPADINTDTADD